MTFSIVARDSATGMIGVATATAGPAVGALVPHAKAGVAAVATQAMTNPYLAVDLIEHLGEQDVQRALEQALAVDSERERRQIIAVDNRGRTALWTGSLCQGYAGHAAGDGVAVAGNILAGGGVLLAMLERFEQTGTLAERLLAALVAGEIAGGDSRGTSSAALKVYHHEAYAAVDLRVDWSENPLNNLSSLLERTTNGGYAEFLASVPRRG